MSISNKKIGLPLDGKVDFLDKFADDFEQMAKGKKDCTKKLSYEINHSEEPIKVSKSARKAALEEISNKKLVKVAFDTRRINQETDRNPRSNLQYWNRTAQFVDDELHDKINTFGKLMSVLQDIKSDFGTQPEYFESYSRVLYDQVERILRVKQGDLEIFKPQIAYLEQLMFARYRITMEELSKLGFSDLKAKILSKDESLLKRGQFLLATEKPTNASKGETFVIKDGNIGNTKDSIINAIFGNSNFRREGERVVERTITVTIKDEVLE